ncbi:MAG: DUF1569 domain-containing protein [Cytophagaceae bacterium]|jgi:hypothetical protein|nr:DUF1569 domain-containing protein [Cytophagaceae bacterium]
MALPSVFAPETIQQLQARIHQLKPESKAQWGTMSVAQMLAHCNVTYEMAYENKHKAPPIFMKWMLKAFVKNSVVNEVPYKKGSATAPAFIIKEEKSFDIEKKRLLDYITKTESLGASHFDQKESLSFGKLSLEEWNNMFYKHLDHHLKQFGV